MVPAGGEGARMPLAAVFKRPVLHNSTSVDSMHMGGRGMAPLAVLMKKQLPASSYPAQQAQQQLGLRSQQQGQHQRELSGQYGADDEYNYIGVYMGSNSGSPVMGEYGRGGHGGRAGYVEGRFTTDLEGLR